MTMWHIEPIWLYLHRSNISPVFHRYHLVSWKHSWVIYLRTSFACFRFLPYENNSPTPGDFIDLVRLGIVRSQDDLKAEKKQNCTKAEDISTCPTSSLVASSWARLKLEVKNFRSTGLCLPLHSLNCSYSTNWVKMSWRRLKTVVLFNTWITAIQWVNREDWDKSNLVW